MILFLEWISRSMKKNLNRASTVGSYHHHHHLHLNKHARLCKSPCHSFNSTSVLTHPLQILMLCISYEFSFRAHERDLQAPSWLYLLCKGGLPPAPASCPSHPSLPVSWWDHPGADRCWQWRRQGPGCGLPSHGSLYHSWAAYHIPFCSNFTTRPGRLAPWEASQCVIVIICKVPRLFPISFF